MSNSLTQLRISKKPRKRSVGQYDGMTPLEIVQSTSANNKKKLRAKAKQANAKCPPATAIIAAWKQAIMECGPDQGYVSINPRSKTMYILLHEMGANQLPKDTTPVDFIHWCVHNWGILRGDNILDWNKSVHRGKFEFVNDYPELPDFPFFCYRYKDFLYSYMLSLNASMETPDSPVHHLFTEKPHKPLHAAVTNLRRGLDELTENCVLIRHAIAHQGQIGEKRITNLAEYKKWEKLASPLLRNAERTVTDCSNWLQDNTDPEDFVLLNWNRTVVDMNRNIIITLLGE